MRSAEHSWLHLQLHYTGGFRHDLIPAAAADYTDKSNVLTTSAAVIVAGGEPASGSNQMQHESNVRLLKPVASSNPLLFASLATVSFIGAFAGFIFPNYIAALAPSPTEGLTYTLVRLKISW